MDDDFSFLDTTIYDDEYVYDFADQYGEEDLQREDSGSYYDDYNFLTDILTEEDLQREDSGSFYDLVEEDPSFLDSLKDIAIKFGTSALSGLTKTFTKPGGGVDWRTIATIGGGVMGLMGAGKAEQRPTGYQGKIPEYTAVRERVGDTYDPERRPGSSGQRYFSDIAFAAPEGIEAARTAAQEQATGLGALNVANPAIQKRPAARAEPEAMEEIDTATRPASAVIEDKPVPKYATGGIAGLKKGDYLRGDTDGMADKLRTTIENKQPAALSHGEFVVPADVVSHLGNGNSEAGAKKLYEMMNRIRQARTGTTKQGKQINPEKYTPA